MIRKIYILGIFLMNLSFAQASPMVQAPSETVATDETEQVVTPSVAPERLTKAMADSAYIRSDFASAVATYKHILQEQGESADLYYNLGNSYYKMGQIAKAILNYERALLLNPGDTDIRFNLELARSKAVDKVTPTSQVFFVLWMNDLTHIQSEKAWANWGIVFFLLTLLMLSLYIFGKRIAFKKMGFFAAIVFLLLTVFANILASRQKEELLNRDQAIVIAPSVTVKSTPNESGTDLFIVHEGRKVQIKDNTMKEWKEIKLEDGHVGWVPASVIEVI